ncbi:MAG: hypothetical protein ACOCQR_00880 [bacterium]
MWKINIPSQNCPWLKTITNLDYDNDLVLDCRCEHDNTPNGHCAFKSCPIRTKNNDSIK